ncbi:MAG TPA: hypothetical protein PKV27_09825, partial [Ilumatobacteraceae bacterium]|nr:hypothetical protein [Ilumatobacteraceae bacterium]
MAGVVTAATSIASVEASTAGPCWSLVTVITAVRSPQSIVGTRATTPSFRGQTVVRSVAKRRLGSGTTTCPRAQPERFAGWCRFQLP